MFTGIEWVIIGVVALVIILWGPSKIPELAKSIGRAKGEFDKATKEYKKTADAVANEPPTPPATPAKVVVENDNLIDTAKKFGLNVEGKSRAQISAELSDKIKSIGTQ